LDNIEQHHVWLDHWNTPSKHLNTTWVFKTKPATASSPEKPKARLCIQCFLQTYGEDFFEMFAPTGKFWRCWSWPLIYLYQKARGTNEFKDLILNPFPKCSAHEPDILLGMDLDIKPDSIGL
ncbi:hypothetical protein VP01_12361g1, partial [Puccinia sorghi]